MTVMAYMFVAYILIVCETCLPIKTVPSCQAAHASCAAPEREPIGNDEDEGEAVADGCIVMAYVVVARTRERP